MAVRCLELKKAYTFSAEVREWLTGFKKNSMLLSVLV